MGLYSGGLIIGRIFASEIWVGYFWEGLFLFINFFFFFLGGGGGGAGGLIIGILRYVMLGFHFHPGGAQTANTSVKRNTTVK